MKFLKKFFEICALILVCITAGFITANLIAKPVFLTNEEIRYYTDTAETAWYEGLSSITEYEEIDVESNLKKHQVHIIPFNKNKQSLTVTFSDDTPIITINKPVVNFWGCFFFYGLFFGFSAFTMLYLLVMVIKRAVRSHYLKKCQEDIL